MSTPSHASGHDSHAAAHGAGEHVHHGDYVKIWFVLVALLVVSVVGPMAEIPALTLITAFGIAFVKAFLVIKNFMHLTVQPRYILYLMGTMLAFMLLFFAGVGPDVMKHEGQRWENRAAKQAVERGLAETAARGGGHH